jgi:hypothetical protein
VRGWLGSPLWRKGRFRTARELRSLAERSGLAVESVQGAIYYPRCGLLAQMFEPVDARFGRATIGAAFLALAAVKPLPAS